jgi:hypothetical protein
MSPKRQGTATVSKAPKRAAPAAAPLALPAWAAPAVYALVTIILFRDFILGPDLVLGSDTQALSYFARNFYTQFVQRMHSFPLWDPLLFGGLPFIDGMHGDIFYPPSLALFFLRAETMWGWKMALHIFLAGVFTYVWLRELGARREIALFGGLVYMMGADLVSLVYPGGDGKLFVSALAPLAFLLTERAAARRRVQDYALFSLGIALLVFTSHMQLVYFAIWGVSLYFMFRLFQWWRAEKRAGPVLAHFAAFVLAGVLGAGAAAIQIIPPLEYLRTYSHRVERTLEAEGEAGYQFATTYSLHPEEIVSLVVPEFVGDDAPSQTRERTYWGRNPFKINHEYAGFLPLLLLGAFFLRRRNGQAWFFAGLATLSLLYALGADTPIFRLFYLIPGVKLFRAPSLIIFLFALSVTTLGALGLQRLLSWADGPEPERAAARKYLWLATGVMGVLLVLAASGVLMSIWQAVFYRGLSDPRKLGALAANTPRITQGFLITFALALATVGVWEGLARGVYGRGLAVVLICLLAFLDLYRVGRPFIHSTVLINDPNSAMFRGDEGTGFLHGRQQAGEVFRALDLRYLTQQHNDPNLLAIHGIEQLAGHHGNEMGRYRNLVGGDSMDRLQPSDFRLMDVTNTQYMVSGQLIGDSARFREVYRGSSTVVYQKVGALPRAYLVGRTEVVSDAQALDRLLAPDFDYRRSALVERALPSGMGLQPDPQGSVQWLERGTNAYRLRVTTDRPALLMVLDNYYPMWEARVDDQPVEIVRANYTFRAVPITTPGQHDVEFRYTAANVKTPAYISAALLTLLTLLGFGPPLRRRFRRSEAAA